MKRLVTITAVLALLLVACGESGAQSGGAITNPPDSPSAVSSTNPVDDASHETGGDTTAPPTGGGASDTAAPGGVTTTTLQPADPPSGTDDGEVFVDVFFVKDATSAVAVQRPVSGSEVAAGAIAHLIEGPTDAEQGEGLYSAVPVDTLVLGLTIDGGTATIDLSREFEQGGGSFNILSRLAQVVYTLTQFDSVDRVVFWLDGEPVDVFSGEGVVLEDPVARADYATILPIGSVTASADRWSQDDLPSLDGVAVSDRAAVVLVAEDDTLNVRDTAGVDGDVIGMLEPDVTVILAGDEETVGASGWVEVRTPDGTGWVNGTFLAAAVPADVFDADVDVITLLDEFIAAIELDADITPYVSERGLYVAYNAPPVRFARDALDGITTDGTTYQWPSPALETDSPENPYRTFAEAVTDSFVSAYADDDTVIRRNEPFEGGNGRLPQDAIPFEFSGFNYLAVHDPGDNPEYGGLDWSTWYVSIDYESGRPVIVGLTVDQWSP